MAQLLASLPSREDAMCLARRIRLAVLAGRISHEQALELYHQIDRQHSDLTQDEHGAKPNGSSH